MKRNSITVYTVFALCFVFLQISYADYDIPEKALRLIDQVEIDEARKELNKFQRTQPDNALVIFYLGKIEEDYNKALWYFKEVEILADSALAAEALLQRAGIVFSRGNLSEAKGLYERLTDVYASSRFSVDAYYRLGIIELVDKNPEDAIEYFNTCIESDTSGTKRLLAVSGKMECYVALEDWNQALETALDVLKEKDEVSSVTPRVLEVIAQSWRKLGNENNANKFTERLLKNYPYSYQAHAIREEGKRITGESVYSFDSETVLSDSLEFEETDTGSVHAKSANFSVQAGAFKDRNRALKILRALKEKGFDARADMKTVSNTHLFVVQVGYFETREEADEMVERVSEVTGDKAIVLILN